LTVSPQVTKSISQFLARSRDRNDRSNRAEFLQSLAEKRQAPTAGTSDQTSSSTTNDEETQENFSCARVDAKTIDRAKQIKYDIMKNEDGPLKGTASIKPSSDPAVMAQNPSESVTVASSSTSSANHRSSPLDEPRLPLRKKRRLAHVEDSSKNSSKTEGQPPVLSLPQNIQDGTGAISSALEPAIDDRIRSIEDHLSIRYGTIAHLLSINKNTYFIPQCLRHRRPSLTGSNIWKIILFDSRKSTHPGRLCISTNQIEGYVRPPPYYFYY
jgi:hypothetical protein